MSKQKYRKGIKSLEKETSIHKDTKLKKAQVEDRLELAYYYEKEIQRLEEQLAEKRENYYREKKELNQKVKNTYAGT